jgi:hypothetical protein
MAVQHAPVSIRNRPGDRRLCERSFLPADSGRVELNSRYKKLKSIRDSERNDPCCLNWGVAQSRAAMARTHSVPALAIGLLVVAASDARCWGEWCGVDQAPPALRASRGLRAGPPHAAAGGPRLDRALGFAPGQPWLRGQGPSTSGPGARAQVCRFLPRPAPRAPPRIGLQRGAATHLVCLAAPGDTQGEGSDASDEEATAADATDSDEASYDGVADSATADGASEDAADDAGADEDAAAGDDGDNAFLVRAH